MSKCQLTDAEINHLRRLLGYVRCEIGQSPEELIATAREIAPIVGEVSPAGVQRMREAGEKSAARSLIGQSTALAPRLRRKKFLIWSENATGREKMKMAKATESDMAAAAELMGILNNVDKGYYPSHPGSEENDPHHFDADDNEHLRMLYLRIQGCMDRSPGFIGRVVMGMDTILHANVLDPDDDCLSLHPRFAAKDAEIERLNALLADHDQLNKDCLARLVKHIPAAQAALQEKK